MLEKTFICDHCDARHTGDNPPLGWLNSFRVNTDAPGLPSYSPYLINETIGHLCDVCTVRITGAIREVTYACR